MIERTEPWITEAANKILAEIVTQGKNLHVFEYGAGASTIWFANNTNVSKLISVENSAVWAAAIINNLDDQKCESDILYRKTPYNAAIDNYEMFDIIMVDGRNRVKCIASAIPHLKPGGILILDNSERDYYQSGIDLMKGWDRTDTTQPNPDKYGFTYPGWATSFFKKPKT